MTTQTPTAQEEITRLLINFYLQPQLLEHKEAVKKKQRVIVIAGPTGSGKSALAIMLAKAAGGEIISADSMQVYRGMDIGTAKVTKEERLATPHHLIDIQDVTESFNVVDFYSAALPRCREILDRGNVPIIAGGSGFYLHALLYGPPSGPPSVPEVRQQLEEEWENLGPDVLFGRLQQQDPIYAASITCNDKQKVVRALEIIILTGQRVSDISWKGRLVPHNLDFRCWFIYRPKEILYHRIEKRCDKMLEDGLVEEVRALDKAGIRLNNSAAQAIGYRQTLDYLDSKQTDVDYDHYVQAFKQASRRYAKRQFTWFRREPLYRWVDIELHDRETAVDIILSDYYNG